MQKKNGIGCDCKGCNLSYKEHTSDTVLFVRGLVKTKSPAELENIQDYLKNIQGKLEELKIDGIAFIEGFGEKDDEEN